MKTRKTVSVLLSVVMIIVLASQPILATNAENSANSATAVSAIDYQSIADKITEAKESFSVPSGDSFFDYYWGSNYFVVHDESGYYYVEHNDDFTLFYVNGIEFNFKLAVYNNHATSFRDDYPTQWFTIYNTTDTYNVGGLPSSVIGGIIGAAIGSLVPGLLLSAIVSIVVGSLASTLIDGKLPLDYKITVRFFKQYRIITLGPPLTIEYYERIGVYGGPSTNLYQSTLYYNTRTYTEYNWE